jgi:hypothetical protein
MHAGGRLQQPAHLPVMQISPAPQVVVPHVFPTPPVPAEPPLPPAFEPANPPTPPAPPLCAPPLPWPPVLDPPAPGFGSVTQCPFTHFVGPHKKQPRCGQSPSELHESPVVPPAPPELVLPPVDVDAPEPPLAADPPVPVVPPGMPAAPDDPPVAAPPPAEFVTPPPERAPPAFIAPPAERVPPVLPASFVELRVSKLLPLHATNMIAGATNTLMQRAIVSLLARSESYACRHGRIDARYRAGSR